MLLAMKNHLFLIICCLSLVNLVHSKTTASMLNARERLASDITLPTTSNRSTSVITNNPDGSTVTTTTNYDLDQDNALVAIAQRVSLLDNKINSNNINLEAKITALQSKISQLEEKLQNIVEDPGMLDTIKKFFSSDKNVSTSSKKKVSN
jgi:hypothetical protein